MQKNKFLWIYLLILICFVGIYCFLFWSVPLSEDAGLYGYLSRAISNGVPLHKQIPFASNSLALYLVALVFKLFGATFNTYRFVHCLGLLFLVVITFLLTSKAINYFFGFIAALMAGVFVVVPHITLDLGRHYLYWAIAILLSGIVINNSKLKNKDVLYGITLGISALIRETFIVVVFFLIFLEIFKTKKKIGYKKSIKFVISFFLTLLLNALILTLFNSWKEYFRDLLQSGTSFRYSLGLLTLGRISENLLHLKYGFVNIYYPLFILGFLSYFVRTKNKIILIIKQILIPAFLLEIIVINKTVEYTVIPLLVLLSILSSFLISEMKRKSRYFTLFLVAIFLISLYPISFIRNEFSAYYKSAKQMSSTDLKNSNEHTNRLLYIVGLIPHNSIAAYSQFPLLFLSKKFYSSPFFTEDLSAGANLNRKDLWENQLNYLKINPPDLLVLKTTTNSYSSKYDDLGKIIYENYITIADFDFTEILTAYKDRILISKKAFIKSYVKQKEEYKDFLNINKTSIFEGYNPYNYAIIVGIHTNPQEYVKFLTISSNHSEIKYKEVCTNDLLLFSLIPPKTKFNIKSSFIKTPSNKFVKLDIYLPK